MDTEREYPVTEAHGYAKGLKDIKAQELTISNDECIFGNLEEVAYCMKTWCKYRFQCGKIRVK